MILLLTLFSGGTGTPKLLQGLKELIPENEISVVVNTGEDVKVSGLHMSPDLDTVVYTLADLIDDEKWYGVSEDTFQTHDFLKKLGHEEILKIGDKDRAIKLYRTFRMQNGASLSQVTQEICEGFGVEAKVFPMTNDRVTTKIDTETGEMLFHEYWVERQARDEVKDVKFHGASEAKPAPKVIETLKDSEKIIIGPSNPITSLGPILSIKEIREYLEENREKVLAISPVIGEAPVSGPTGNLMRGLGHEVTSVGVARIYRDFVKMFVLHEEDEPMIGRVEDLGMSVFSKDILIPDFSSRVSLAEEILSIIDYD